MPPCKACAEDILFIRTPTGKHIPVDADSYDTYTLEPGVTVVTDAGQVLRGSARTAQTRVMGYTPHWDCCPHADTFRKSR